MGGQPNGSTQQETPAAPEQSVFSKIVSSVQRLRTAGLNPGASYGFPEFKPAAVSTPTYVPTKIQISLVCLPMISRYAAATQFGLAKYSTGELSRGSINPNIGGIW
jgi:hypothetical protein